MLAMLTPGGRQRQGTPSNDLPNNAVNQDADADPASSVSFGDVQGRNNPQILPLVMVPPYKFV